MYKRTTTVVSLAIAILLAGISHAQEDLKFNDLPNLHVVNSNLYRGAQPGPGGISRLKQLGVKTVINLRDDDERAKTEEAEANAAGLQYFNISLANFARPSQATVSKILELINAPENQPVFVHCKRGADRTGTIIAVYRIDHDGWTSEKATAEAKRYGLGFWQVGMKDYIHDYYERRTRRKDGSATPAQPD